MNRAPHSTLTGSPASILSRLRFLAATCLTLGIAACSPQAKIDRILQSAQKSHEAGDYEKAKAEYASVFRVDSKNPTAMRQLGLIWFEEGALLKSFPFLRRASELQPEDATVRTKLALVYLGFGDRAKAKAEVLTLLQKAPNNDEGLTLLADSAGTKEELDFAAQELKKHSDPDRAAVHLAAASLAGHRGDLVAAEKEVQKAAELDPKSIPALLARGTFSMARKDMKEAETSFQRAADLAPLRSTARLKLAEFKIVAGAKEDARLMLKDLTEKAPDYVPAWAARADMASAEGKEGLHKSRLPARKLAHNLSQDSRGDVSAGSGPHVR
jgi:Tfp pilus assembly protein PilF